MPLSHLGEIRAGDDRIADGVQFLIGRQRIRRSGRWFYADEDVTRIDQLGLTRIHLTYERVDHLTVDQVGSREVGAVCLDFVQDLRVPVKPRLPGRKDLQAEVHVAVEEVLVGTERVGSGNILSARRAGIALLKFFQRKHVVSNDGNDARII